jgi:hypothetical protein
MIARVHESLLTRYDSLCVCVLSDYVYVYVHSHLDFDLPLLFDLPHHTFPISHHVVSLPQLYEVTRELEGVHWQDIVPKGEALTRLPVNVSPPKRHFCRDWQPNYIGFACL